MRQFTREMTEEEKVGSRARGDKGLHADGRIEWGGSADRSKVVGGLVLERQATDCVNGNVGIAGQRLSL